MDWRVAQDEGQQSLEHTLARRDSSTRLLMQLSQEEQRRKESERNFKLSEEVRKGALARQVAQDKTTAEDRDETRKLAKITRTQAGARLLAPGSKITNPQEVADMRDAGLGSRLKEIMRPTALPNGAVGPVDSSDFVEGQHEFMGTSDQLDAQARQDNAQARLEETQRMNELRNEVAMGRLTVAQAQATLAQDKLAFERTKPFAPQVMPGADGDVAVQFSRDGTSRSVPLPGGAHKTKTPAQIQAEAAARSQGTAEGKAAGTPQRNILGPLAGIFGGAPKAGPAAPATSTASTGTVRIQAPDGSVKEMSEAEAAHYLSRGAKRVQ